MQPELIARLVKLIEKTGDRVILPDPVSGKAVVVLDLDAYERLCAVPAAAEEVTKPAAPSVVDPIPGFGPAATDAFSPKPVAEAVVPPSPAVVPTPAAVERPTVRTPEPDLPIIPEDKAKTKGLEDLTQEELLDKINRDIDAWKTAQDTKRTEELRSAARDLEPLTATSQLEEEERFFLEPIE